MLIILIKFLTLKLPKIIKTILLNNAFWYVEQVCSVVFFNYAIVQKFLAFHVRPPLDACTYMGLDSGELPIQVRAIL